MFVDQFLVPILELLKVIHWPIAKPASLFSSVVPGSECGHSGHGFLLPCLQRRLVEMVWVLGQRVQWICQRDQT